MLRLSSDVPVNNNTYDNVKEHRIMCSVKWIMVLVMLAACWAQEGEWSEDAEDLGKKNIMINTKLSLMSFT